MAETELHVELRITDAVADLVIVSSGKYREGGTERDQAHRAQSGGHVDHVRFRDSAVKEPVREFLLEGVGHGCGREVGIQNDDPVIGLAQFHQGFTVSDTCCFLIHFFSPPILSAPAQPVPHSVLFRASRPGLP